MLDEVPVSHPPYLSSYSNFCYIQYLYFTFLAECVTVLMIDYDGGWFENSPSHFCNITF